MPFYEVLKILMTDPGKHQFRRKRWEGEYTHNDTAYIASIGITVNEIRIVLVNKSNHTGYSYCPSAADVIANDWFEV